MSYVSNDIDRSPSHSGAFEDAYIALRKKEQRVYTDDEIRKLPDISSTHPHYKEWQMRKESCKRLLAYLRSKSPALNILEIGCGNGWLTSHLAAITSGKVRGIDINSYELRQAERVFNTSGNIQFMYGDIRCDITEDLKFDVIVFAASMQYFPSVIQIVRTAFNCLAPEGEIHILDTHFYKPAEIPFAKERTKEYYRRMGLEQMSAWYFHHGIDELRSLKYRILYNPEGWINKFSNKRNPFYWICVKEN